MVSRRQVLAGTAIAMPCLWGVNTLTRSPRKLVLGKVVRIEWHFDGSVHNGIPVDLWFDTQAPDIEGEVDPRFCPSWEDKSSITVSERVHETLTAQFAVHYTLVIGNLPDEFGLSTGPDSRRAVDRSTFNDVGLGDTVVVDRPALGDPTLVLVDDRKLSSVPDESEEIDILRRYASAGIDSSMVPSRQ